jgi:D-alanyl-lipoteichoic acid acyltransferase DltB (MBOAT superfamily)
MLFHTWVFFIFFAVVYAVYLPLRKHSAAMNLWLMLASYFFYGWWNPYYLLLLFGTSAIDYWMVMLMARSRSHRTKKIWLVTSLVSNFGFLGFFKYSYFFTDNLNVLLTHFGATFQLPDPVAYPNAVLHGFGMSDSSLFAHVLLPIGISFHTFQSMSYTIDAYRGTVEPERSFVRFLCFVSFFPQLVAGPIERARNLLPQLQGYPKITRHDIAEGLSHFLVGYFKKVALADYLAMYVDKIYGSPGNAGAPALILATIAFGWQIYFDFSGYTDMARGIAMMMGFRLMLNFNNPYTATGLGDFWTRWHISLSTWFKDYIYFPLGGNRHGKWRTYRNMLLTMVISGVWHGAAWTFVIWGALHAIGRVVTRELEETKLYRDRVPKLAKQIGVFIFVSFAWIFFRAQSLDDAQTIIARIFTASWTDPQFPLLMAAMILAVWIYQLVFADESRVRNVLALAPVRFGLAAAMVFYIAIIAQRGTQAFIYFQF